MCNVAAIWFSSDSVILERGIVVYERKLDEVELMQATGVWSICDDGITEIYEGDIVKMRMMKLMQLNGLMQHFI